MFFNIPPSSVSEGPLRYLSASSHTQHSSSRSRAGTLSNFRRDQQPNMAGLPKQQDHVEHFRATKSWTATNSETMQSRSLTAKPLILDSTTLRPQTPEPSSARNGKASNLSKYSKTIEIRTANRNPSTKMPCTQKTAHLEKMVGESRGRVGESRGRVGESRGQATCIQGSQDRRVGREILYIYACVCACIMTIEGCATV